MTKSPSGTELDRNTPFYVGEWLVEPASGRISREDRVVKLEPRVMDLLICLASRPGEVMSREELESIVWAGMIVGYDSLASAVIKLRKAFEDDSRNPKVIETVSKRGYRLIEKLAPATHLGVHHAPPTSGGSEAEASDSAERTPPTELRSFERRRRQRQGIIFSVLIVVLLIFYQWLAPTNGPGVPESSTAKASLVVLPFANSNNDKEQEYFSDGITDDLINDLSQYSGLNVMARRTSYIYKQRSTDIQTIAHDLGVTYVVDGDVRRDGNRLRINVQLIDANTGVNIWAQRFDRQTKDIFSVQDDIRKNIITALSVSLTAEERNREQVRYTSSFEAYDVFLQGQAKLVSRTAADNKQAQELMRRATELDPNFARAYAALAYTLADAFRQAWIDDADKMRRQALAAGKRAIELDPKLYQTYWIMGNVYLFMFNDHDKAIEMGERAVALAPHDNDSLLTLAVTYDYGGNPAKGKLMAQEIMRRNSSYSSLVPSVLGMANILLGNYPEALDAYNKSLEINPTYVSALANKVLILYRLGRVDDALFQVDELYNLHPNFDLKNWAARLPFKDKSINQHFIDDLIKAGVKP